MSQDQNKVELNKIKNDDILFLYTLLENRDPSYNISHKIMPSYDEHERFVKTRPYTNWYVILLNSKKIALVINTGGGNSEHRLGDAMALRRATLVNKVPYCTNMSTAQACLMGIRSLKTREITVTSDQLDYLY